MSIPMYGVSTFTTEFFRGNPACVVLLAADDVRQDDWYHRVSAMTAQPATAFLQPADGGFGLRWFTPNAELSLAVTAPWRPPTSCTRPRWSGRTTRSS